MCVRVCACVFFFCFFFCIKSCDNSVISLVYSECICENMRICVSLNTMLTQYASGTRYVLKTHDDQCVISKLSTALTK